MPGYGHILQLWTCISPFQRLFLLNGSFSYRKMLILDWQAVAVVSTYRIKAEVIIVDKLVFLYGYRHFPSSFFQDNNNK
jgi:hypothetical protein